MIGKVVGRLIGVTGDLMLRVELTGPGDVQVIEAALQAGQDYNPPNGSHVLVVKVTSHYRVAIPISDSLVTAMLAGEREIYSTDSEGAEKKAFIRWLSDGTVRVNGDADFAVRYSALETAFNQLKYDFDHHTHGGVLVGPGSTLPPPASTADISGAKVETVLLP